MRVFEEEYAKVQAQLADMLDREARAKRALEAERASRLRQIDEEMARRNAAIKERIMLEMEAELEERSKALDARERKIDARKQMLESHKQKLDARLEAIEKTGDVKSFEDLIKTCSEILDEVIDKNNRRIV